MVKFGRRLVSERHEEWSEYYIDYKGLKRLVYEAREDPTKVEAYKLGLRGEISKVRATPKNKRFSLP